MINVDIYEIEGEEYILVDTIKSSSETYLYLINKNKNKSTDTMIRKVDKTDPNYILPLKDEVEVKKAALLFASKMAKKTKKQP